MEKVVFFFFGRGFDLKWRGEMRVGVYMSEMGCVMLFFFFLFLRLWSMGLVYLFYDSFFFCGYLALV